MLCRNIFYSVCLWPCDILGEHALLHISTDRPPAPEGIHIKNHPSGRLLLWNPVPEVYQVLVYTIIGRGGDHEELRQEVFEEVTEVLLDTFHFEHSYNVTMTATSYCGTSPESEPVFVADIPNLEPPNVTVVNRTDITISIRIEPSNRGERVDSYRIQYTVPNAPDEILDIHNISQPIILKTGLKECFNHTISVYAKNPADESEPTVINAMLLSKNVPQQPILTDVITIGQKTMVQWSTNSSTQLVTHKIEYTDNVNKYIDWAIGDANEIWLSNMRGCRRFTIHVSSENTCGWSEYSQPTDYEVPPTVPASTPSQLTVTGTADVPQQPILTDVITIGQKTMVQWSTNSSTQLVTHKIEYTDNVNKYIDWAIGDANEIWLSNMRGCRRFTIHVSSENTCGWSEYSQPTDYEVPPTVPASTPSQLTVTGTAGELLLQWNQPNSTEHLIDYDILHRFYRSAGQCRSYWSAGSMIS
ncbi:hypothetical protein AHF37_08910 [Paragonimus kellicotti]|nr:hypothetical protein AHF37_08910 [Paragonimus kellicotti]